MGGCVCLIQQSNCTQRFSVCFGWQCASQSVFRNARQPESVRCSVQDSNGQEGRNARKTDFTPDGHLKLLHLWPVKLLQAGRSDGDYTGVAVMREAASFKR